MLLCESLAIWNALLKFSSVRSRIVMLVMDQSFDQGRYKNKTSDVSRDIEDKGACGDVREMSGACQGRGTRTAPFDSYFVHKYIE